MKHLTKLFLTLSLIVTLVLGVLGSAVSKRTAVPRGPQKSLVKKPKPHAPNQSASGHRPLPSTPDVVAVDTTAPAGISGHLSWLFTKVHYAVLLVGIPLVLKTSYDASLEEASLRKGEVHVGEGEEIYFKMEEVQEREPKKKTILERIKCVVKDVAMSLFNPMVHSSVLYSLLVNRFFPWKFTVESFFGLDKYIDPTTFKFARLVVPFCFMNYSYRVPRLLAGKLDNPKLVLLLPSVLRCLSYFLPVIAMVGAALGEVIFFVWSMVSGKKSGRVPSGRGEKRQY